MTRHLVVIGAQRSGTSYLTTVLDAHPEVTMARPARPEPKAFLDPRTVSRGVDRYRETYFAHATTELLLGEKSTSYIESPEAAGRVAEVLGSPHVVALLRDPVQRAVSNWRFSTDHGFESRPLETALRENLAGPSPWDPNATSVSPVAYHERGRYVDYLEPWLTAFPTTMHVCFLRDLLDDGAALGDLFETLGVDATFRPPRQDRAVNQSNHPAPALPDDLREQLDDYFAESDAALAERLGRALPW